MPAQAPPTGPAAAIQLALIGQRIRTHRQALRVSATAAAEAAGMSRVTLHRIERGEPSVTMGAWMNAAAVLGLQIDVGSPDQAATLHNGQDGADGDTALPVRIRLADYPQLKRLAWHIPGAAELTPQEALGLYERNWRHIDSQAMQAHERELVEKLARVLGRGHLLV